MSKIIAIVLFIVLSFQLVAKLGVVTLYEANKAYIAQNLCENRAKPKMHCNGKCYLKKQLKKLHDPESSDNLGAKSELQLITFIIPVVRPTVFSFDEIFILQHHSRDFSILGTDILKDVFHPPQQIC